MLTLQKDSNGFLDFTLTDDPTKSQAEGLKAWLELLKETAEAQSGDMTAPIGHECDLYDNLHGNVDLLLRYLHDLNGHAEGADAQFIADVVKAFREWIDADPAMEAHWRFDFEDVLDLWK